MVRPATDPGVPRGFAENRGVHYAPRIGFAWDIFGNGKTALRGGFGIFYNRQNLDAQILDAGFQIPLVQNSVVYFSTFEEFLGAEGFVSPQNVIGIDPIGKIPTVYNWSLGIQRDIG